MKITCQERIGEAAEPETVPVIPLDATMDEIEAIVAAELSAHLIEGVTPEGGAR